ncbi:MAG: AAA family ATPase [Capsulimonadales bacterium]|nr:AAA family ATPase [Capsulimonadales bacterium]
MPLSSPRLIVITGIMASGKSTVAQGIAERLPRSVHLRGDLFRRLIVNGRAEMCAELTPEALSQLRFRYRIAATVAEEYLAAGFDVVYQDILIGAGLSDAIARLRHPLLYVVVLCPQIHAVTAREAGRAKTGYRSETEIAAFDRILRRETPTVGYWIDSTDLTPSETVEDVLANLDRARIDRT